MFGLITMIGGYLDADFQYEMVSKTLRAHRREYLPDRLILPVVAQELNSNEEDSDFDTDPASSHEDDDYIYQKVSSRVCRRVQYFCR